MADAIADMADDGASAIMVVPVSFLSDRVDTAFDLDVTARAVAKSEGISQFEVTNGLNCHPLVIDALADCVGTHVELPESLGGDGLAVSHVGTEFDISEGSPCPVCDRALPIRQWTTIPEADVSTPEIPNP